MSGSEILQATHRLGLRLYARTPYSDAECHRLLANKAGAEGAPDTRVLEAIARVLEEIEAAEGAPIHELTDAQVDPYLRRMSEIERERRKPVDPETTARALRVSEEMRRDYGDVGRRKIA